MRLLADQVILSGLFVSQLVGFHLRVPVLGVESEIPGVDLDVLDSWGGVLFGW